MEIREQSDTTSSKKVDVLSKLFGVVDGNPILNILVVGDSTLAENNNFITPFVTNKLVNAKVISESNLTASTLLRTIQSELQNVKYQLVIIMYGHDETALTTPRTTLATLRQSINVARSRGSEVLLILTPFDTKSDDNLVELQQTYMQLLYKWMELKSVTVIDGLIKSTGSISVKTKQLSIDAIKTIAKILVKILPNFLSKRTDKTAAVDKPQTTTTANITIPSDAAVALSSQEDEAFYEAILSSLGVQSTPEKIKFLKAWRQAEGGRARNNPFNTTMNMPVDGVTNYNSVGVKNYPDMQTGLTATVKTLKLSYYADLVAKLNNDNITAAELANTNSLYTWGTGAGVTRVLSGKSINPPLIFS
jgi:hypothetical protein